MLPDQRIFPQGRNAPTQGMPIIRPVQAASLSFVSHLLRLIHPLPTEINVDSGPVGQYTIHPQSTNIRSTTKNPQCASRQISPSSLSSPWFPPQRLK